MDSGTLYLDYNATSPPSSSVLNWLKGGDLLFGNPSSQHSSGKAARKAINETRSQLYQSFNLKDSEFQLFFTSGATESLVSFAHSFSEHARSLNKNLLICYSGVDHPAVSSLHERKWNDHVSFFEIKRKSNLDYDYGENFSALKSLKDKNPDLIILYHHLWVHNETGLVSKLKELEILKTLPDLFIHVDAVQAPGKIREYKDLIVGDIFTFSAHKFGALKGIGFSFFKKEISFKPLITGGGQQMNLRSGTENLQGVLSIREALKDLMMVDVEINFKQRAKLEAFMQNELKGIGEVVLHPDKNNNTIYFYFNSLSSDIAVALFDLEKMEISAGSACSSGAARPSIVLLQMGLMDVAKNGLRLSYELQLSDERLIQIQERFSRVVARIRAAA